MRQNPLPRIKHTKVSDEVYETLRWRIMSEEFAPGQRLDLDEIERQMGISRTPLNEALNRLAADGLVELRPHRGAYVTNPTPLYIAQAFDVRRVLEVYAVEVAAKTATAEEIAQVRHMIEELRKLVEANDWVRIYQQYVSLDHDLHKLIVRLARNEPLEKAWDQVNVHVQMARVRYGTAEEQLAQAQQEHEVILQAFEARDMPALKEAMAFHIERAKRSMLQDMEKKERARLFGRAQGREEAIGVG